MMSSTNIERIIFETDLMRLCDFLSQKEVQIVEIENKFMRIYDATINCLQEHHNLIKEINKLISSVKCILEDIAKLLAELNMEFMSNTFKKLFRLLIFGLKALS